MTFNYYLITILNKYKSDIININIGKINIAKNSISNYFITPMKLTNLNMIGSWKLSILPLALRLSRHTVIPAMSMFRRRVGSSEVMSTKAYFHVESELKHSIEFTFTDRSISSSMNCLLGARV